LFEAFSTPTILADVVITSLAVFLNSAAIVAATLSEKLEIRDGVE